MSSSSGITGSVYVFPNRSHTQKDNIDERLNLQNLIKKNVLNKSYKKIKILGKGEIKTKLNIEADFSSKSALEKVEKIGGTISLKKA